MHDDRPAPSVDPGILEALRAREPLFHRPGPGTARADYEAMIWRREARGWVALHHQGTLVQA